MFIKRLTHYQEDQSIQSLSEFKKRKVALWTYFIVWSLIIVFLLFNWYELAWFIKYPLAILEAVFSPDLGIFRLLFIDYKDYKAKL